MMKEAESHADEDKKRREEIETRNRADQAVYAAERMVKDAGDRLSSSDRAAVESAIEDLKKASAGTDVAAINTAMDALTKAQHTAAESLYKQAQSTGAGGGGGDATPGGGAPPTGDTGSEGGAKQGDVIDAEVVDEK
jgi:molecular chaperone DnaK